MTLKFNRNAKVIRTLTGQCQVRPAAADDLDAISLVTALKNVFVTFNVKLEVKLRFKTFY